MNVTLQEIKECEDGSAIATFEIDEDAKEFLIEQGLLYVIKQSLAEMESKYGADAGSKS